MFCCGSNNGEGCPCVRLFLEKPWTKGFVLVFKVSQLQLNGFVDDASFRLAAGRGGARVSCWACGSGGGVEPHRLAGLLVSYGKAQRKNHYRQRDLVAGTYNKLRTHAFMVACAAAARAQAVLGTRPTLVCCGGCHSKETGASFTHQFLKILVRGKLHTGTHTRARAATPRGGMPVPTSCFWREKLWNVMRCLYSKQK